MPSALAAFGAGAPAPGSGAAGAAAMDFEDSDVEFEDEWEVVGGGGGEAPGGGGDDADHGSGAALAGSLGEPTPSGDITITLDGAHALLWHSALIAASGGLQRLCKRPSGRKREAHCQPPPPNRSRPRC